MRRYVISAMICIPLAAPAARADFVVAPARLPAAGSQGATPEASAPAPDHEDSKPDAKAIRPAVSTHPQFKVAQGFGDQIPLNFAVRQIVPRAVKVTYGPGADPNALVDWKGGQDWNRVLLRAVHPLGLRLVMTDRAVQIRK